MKLTDFTPQDYQTLYAFMRPLWLETYGDILPQEQIELLLDKYFSETSVAHYRTQGYIYQKIDEVGVLVFVERETELYLDKLYLLPAARGKGYPAFVFGELTKKGKDVLLNVNRGNERAVRCYLKNGFVVEKREEIVLPNGMVNHDYVMRKKSAATRNSR